MGEWLWVVFGVLFHRYLPSSIANLRAFQSKGPTDRKWVYISRLATVHTVLQPNKTLSVSASPLTHHADQGNQISHPPSHLLQHRPNQTKGRLLNLHIYIYGYHRILRVRQPMSPPATTPPLFPAPYPSRTTTAVNNQQQPNQAATPLYHPKKDTKIRCPKKKTMQSVS